MAPTEYFDFATIPATRKRKGNQLTPFRVEHAIYANISKLLTGQLKNILARAYKELYGSPQRRQAMCTSKKRFSSEKRVKQELSRFSRTGRRRTIAHRYYKCIICGGYHMSSSSSAPAYSEFINSRAIKVTVLTSNPVVLVSDLTTGEVWVFDYELGKRKIRLIKLTTAEGKTLKWKNFVGDNWPGLLDGFNFSARIVSPTHFNTLYGVVHWLQQLAAYRGIAHPVYAVAESAASKGFVIFDTTSGTCVFLSAIRNEYMDPNTWKMHVEDATLKVVGDSFVAFSTSGVEYKVSPDIYNFEFSGRAQALAKLNVWFR